MKSKSNLMIFDSWNRLEVLFHNIPFPPISIIDSLLNFIKFEKIIRNFPSSLWIRPIFTIIPLNSRYFHEIGKFKIIFDTRICEIDDLTISIRHILDLRSFLEHVDLYQKLIQDFAKVSKPLTTLLCKDKDFIINEEGRRAFVMLKNALIEAPILQCSDWDLPFEIMYDASDYAVGAVLGQRLETKPTAEVHMLCKQDACGSSNELHNNRKGGFGGGLRTRDVLAIHLGEQDHYLQ